MKTKIAHSKPTISKKDARIFEPILESCQIACGKVVREFEKKFSKFVGCADGVATNAGTSALHLALLALGIGKNDEIILPSYVSEALLNAINYVNAKAVIADIDYHTFNISLEDTNRKLTKNTKAIILPHMFGLPCEIDEFLKLGLPIIEDVSLSLGAKYKNKITGSFGNLTISSFYATKFITTGYGGMVVSDSKRLLDKIRDLNEMDKRQDYKIRYMYKMSDLQAALGLDQLKHVPYFIKRRKEIAKLYSGALAGYDLELPTEKNDRDHVFYRYLVKSKNAAFIRNYLNKNGIEVMPPVYKPLHSYLLMAKNNFPATEKVSREVISLPVYPSLKNAELLKVIAVLRHALTK